jgi:iron-sulfur cluster assembly protein
MQELRRRLQPARAFVGPARFRAPRYVRNATNFVQVFDEFARQRLSLERHVNCFRSAAAFRSWKGEMIHLTDSALSAVQTAISSATDPVDGLRIMVEAGGCAGYQYKMGLVREASPDDTVIERNGVKVFIDNTSHELLEGATIDYVVAVQGSGFTFENPNAQSSCSCGKSFG